MWEGEEEESRITQSFCLNKMDKTAFVGMEKIGRSRCLQERTDKSIIDVSGRYTIIGMK